MSWVNRVLGALGFAKAQTGSRSLGKAAAGDLPIWAQFQRIGGGVTPERLSGILRQADNGFPNQLIELGMEARQKDGHLHGILQTRELAIQGLPWELYFPGQDAESTRGSRQKKFVDETIRDNPEFHKLLAHLSGGFYPGYAVSEVIWGVDGDRQIPLEYKPIDGRRFGFSQAGGHLIFRDDPQSMAEIDFRALFPAGKFVTSQPRINGDVECREGLIRVLLWAALFRNWTLGDWLKLGEIAWKPLRVGTYKKDAYASQEDIDKLITILRGLTSSGTAAVPDTVKLDVLWPSGGTGGAGKGNHEALFSVIGREMSKATLGQDGTTEQTSTSGYAQANVLDRIRADVLCADARHISMVITRDVVIPMIRMNFGPTAPIPYFRLVVDEGEDLVAFSEATKNFVDAGLRMPSKWIRNHAGIPSPQEGEEIVGGTPEPDPNAPKPPEKEAA